MLMVDARVLRLIGGRSRKIQLNTIRRRVCSARRLEAYPLRPGDFILPNVGYSVGDLPRLPLFYQSLISACCIYMHMSISGSPMASMNAGTMQFTDILLVDAEDMVDEPVFQKHDDLHVTFRLSGFESDQ